MKKLSIFFLVILLLASLSACGKSNTDGPDSKTTEIVNDATKELIASWRDYYRDINEKDGIFQSDGYFEIKNVRLITLKENDMDKFDEVEYVVEYVLFTDYFGSHPYYINAEYMDAVAVFKDGHMEVMKTNPFRTYISQRFSHDFIDIIEVIEDCGDAFNTSKNLL